MMKGRGTKGRKIRAALAELPPDAKASEVCEKAGLPAKNAPYVYAIRQNMKKERHGAARALTRQPHHIADVLASDLLLLHPAVQKLGGCQRAKEALDALEQLQAVE